MPGTINIITSTPSKKYTITYLGNGNTGGTIPVDSNSPYTSGSSVTVLGNTFTRTNYNFTGWNTEANGSGIPYSSGNIFLMPAASVNLYAQWRQLYTVTYLGNGNTGGTAPVDSNSPYTSGSSVTVLGNTFTRTGYNFTSWNTASNGSGISYSSGNIFSISAANVILYAQWTLPGPVSGLFTGNLVISNWTQVIQQGGGSIDTSNAPTSITMVSGNAGQPVPRPEAYIYIPITIQNVTITVNWNYSTNDGAIWDRFYYRLNGNTTQVSSDSGGNVQNGTFTLNLIVGDTFGFVINTTDGVAGPATVVISGIQQT